jgi:NAD(P)H-hydrate epimerase
MVNVLRPDTNFPADFDAFLVGPGLASPELPDLQMPTRKIWRDVLVPVVVDASALDWLLLGPVPKNAIRVLTPHPGEAARLLTCSVKQVQADRSRAVREISRRFGNCWVVLKGQHTLIGRSSGEIFVNSSGNAHLAQGGSGDALSGFIAGLLAQPALQADMAQTLRSAVWQHGRAADRLQATRSNWVVEDLFELLGRRD